MFVTLQTYHGILVAVMSTVKAVKFLLQNGCLFILTETFCQDPVGEYLSIQRQLGKRNYILIWRNLITMRVKLESRQMYFSPLEICKENKTKKFLD